MIQANNTSFRKPPLLGPPLSLPDMQYIMHSMHGTYSTHACAPARADTCSDGNVYIYRSRTLLAACREETTDLLTACRKEAKASPLQLTGAYRSEGEHDHYSYCYYY